MVAGKYNVIWDAVTYTDHAESKTGLQFPVGRIHRLLRSADGDLFLNSLLGRKGNYTGAPVYMAVVME